MAGLLGLPWAAPGDPGGPLDGGVEVYDWQADVAQMKRESRERYEGRTIAPRSRLEHALDLAASREQRDRCATAKGADPLWRAFMTIRWGVQTRNAQTFCLGLPCEESGTEHRAPTTRAPDGFPARSS